MKKIIFLFAVVLFCSCNFNEGLKPGDFGYKVVNEMGRIEYTYINDSIIKDHRYECLINIHTGKIVGSFNGPIKKLKIKGDNNSVTIEQ